MDRGSSTMGLRSILTKTFCCCCGRRLGNYLAILFVFSKLLYIANVIGQLFILNSVLKTTYNIFGFEFMDNIQTEDGYWVNSPIFPRVTMCDFRVRRLGKFLGNGGYFHVNFVMTNNLMQNASQKSVQKIRTASVAH